MKYDVWYMRPKWFRHGITGARPDPTDLRRTHVFVKTINGDEAVGGNVLESVFFAMQGENWSPRGEAREMIEALGLDHTSMSVGDVVVDDDGTYVVATFGFEKLA